MLTNIQLVQFCESKLGVNYVYGAKGEVLTLQKYNMLKRMYPEQVKDSDKKKIGTVCVDCSGLISWAAGVSYNSSGLYSNASYRADITTIGTAPQGAILYKKGHCGVYIGNNECIEAKGSAYGVIKTKVTATKWTHWLKMDYICYIPEVSESYNNNSYVPGFYKIIVGALNVRSGPEVQSRKIQRALPRNTVLEVSEIKNHSWGYIPEFNGWSNISISYCEKIDNIGNQIKNPIFKIGDKVRVTGLLYSNIHGGSCISKQNAEMHIVKIYVTGKYPFALAKRPQGTVNGYGSKEVLQLCQ